MDLVARITALEDGLCRPGSGGADMDLVARVTALENGLRRLSSRVNAQEQLSRAHADAAEDLRTLVWRDMDRLKASVGELLSSNKSYALEVQQATANAEAMVNDARRSLDAHIQDAVKRALCASQVEVGVVSGAQTTAAADAQCGGWAELSLDRRRHRQHDMPWSPARRRASKMAAEAATQRRLHTADVVASALGTDPFLSIMSIDPGESAMPRATGATIESDLKRLEGRIAAAQAAAAL